jgi:hypothetical protein
VTGCQVGPVPADSMFMSGRAYPFALGGPLDSCRVSDFHVVFRPACDAVRELDQLRELIADPGAILVGTDLVVRTSTLGGRDPGGLKV